MPHLLVWRLLMGASVAHSLSTPITTRREAMMISASSLLATSAAAQPVEASTPTPGAVPGPREIMTSVEVKTGGKTVEVVRPRLTGAGDSSWEYAVTDVSSKILREPFPNAWPYTGVDDFKRLDEAPDTTFYRYPKLVYHIDEGAVAALTHYYAGNIPSGSAILDICSSWVSHYPRDFPGKMRSIVGTGISEIELACNDQLSTYAQADLNVKPKLPFPDSSFDFVTCVVSFDYLNRPLEVMREVRRVLRPGGTVILSQSNRCFYSVRGACSKGGGGGSVLTAWSSLMHDE